MTIDAPLELYRDEVRPEWIDYNGHMNVAYYVLAFDYATDAFFDHIGLDDSYRAKSANSTFAVEAHLTYQREVAEGDPLRFTTQLLGFDDKRLHFVHRMYHAGEGFLAATSEWLSLHIDLRVRRVSILPESIKTRLAEIMDSHERLPRPPEAGRVINCPRRPAV